MKIFSPVGLRRTALLRITTFVALAIPELIIAQSAQIPYLTATSLRRGAVISHDDHTRVIGDTRYSHAFKTTDGICAVKIQLRTLGRLYYPYEVQCFFCAKDPSKARYVYDAARMLSGQTFDEITVVARDLFAGSETRDKATTTTYASGMSPTGETVSLSATRTEKSEKIVPGSNVEGWIVRVLSGGKVVRMDASLQELKTFAEREPSLLDSIAAKLSISQ